MRVFAPVLALLLLQSASRPADVPVQIRMIDGGASETAAIADINKDGRLDIVSGEYWYQAPAWIKHRFREVGFSGNYIDSFSVLPVDVDGDGYLDIVDVSWFARKVAWWKNPGRAGGSELWKEAPVNACCNVEFAVLADMDNDGKIQEVVAQENGTGQSWYEAKNGAWVKHIASDRSYGHGIGYGDVNKDGRNDILTPRGWLEAPADPRAAGNWAFHNDWEAINVSIPPPGRQAAAGGAGGSSGSVVQAPVLELGFMHVIDVDGDGRNDVIAAAGHNYGVFWFQQGENGQWSRRTIDNAWSQGHASTLVDFNGDGRLDLVTGKRFMAHNGSDPGETEPLGVYWYQSRTIPGAAGRAASVEWIRHVVSYGGQLGAGMQVAVADIDGDGDRDIVCGGKSGLFLIENLTKSPAPRPRLRSWEVGTFLLGPEAWGRAEYPPPMRIAFRMSVTAGREAEYERRHSPIWPELETVLLDQGVRTYSIFLDPVTGDLFAYAEIEDEERWRAIASTDVCRRWWRSMRELMPSNADDSPVARDLREVFHIQAT